MNIQTMMQQAREMQERLHKQMADHDLKLEARKLGRD